MADPVDPSKLTMNIDRKTLLMIGEQEIKVFEEAVADESSNVESYGIIRFELDADREEGACAILAWYDPSEAVIQHGGTLTSEEEQRLFLYYTERKVMLRIFSGTGYTATVPLKIEQADALSQTLRTFVAIDRDPSAGRKPPTPVE